METLGAGPSRGPAAGAPTPAQPASSTSAPSSSRPQHQQQAKNAKQGGSQHPHQKKQNHPQQNKSKPANQNAGAANAKGKASTTANPPAPAPALNMHTINLLVQSAAWLAARDATRALVEGQTSDPVLQGQVQAPLITAAGKTKRLKLAAQASDKTLQALSLAKKSTLRLDPSIKRSICKRCHTFLIPGLTEQVRYKASGPHGHLIKHTCLCCTHERSFPAPPTEKRRVETRKRVRERKRKEEAERRQQGVKVKQKKGPGGDGEMEEGKVATPMAQDQDVVVDQHQHARGAEADVMDVDATGER